MQAQLPPAPPPAAAQLAAQQQAAAAAAQAGGAGGSRLSPMDQLLQYKQQLETDLLRVEAQVGLQGPAGTGARRRRQNALRRLPRRPTLRGSGGGGPRPRVHHPLAGI
jgi:hypothetical protein